MSWASKLATGFFEGASSQLPSIFQSLERRDREKRQDEREDKRQQEAAIRQRFQAGDQDGAIAEANSKGMADLANQLAGIKQGVTVADYKGQIGGAEQAIAQAQTALTTAQTPEDLAKPLQQSALAEQTALQQSAPDILSQLPPGQADAAAQAFGAAYDTGVDLTRRQQQLGKLPMLKAQAESEPDISPEIERQLREIVPDTADTLISTIRADKKRGQQKFFEGLVDNPSLAALGARELAKLGGDPRMVDLLNASAAAHAGDEQQALINQHIAREDYEGAAAIYEAMGKPELANSTRNQGQKRERELARREKEFYRSKLFEYLDDERNYYPKGTDGYPDLTKPRYPESKLIETFNKNWSASEQEARKMFAEERELSSTAGKVDAAVQISKAAYQADPNLSASMIEQKMRNDDSFSEVEISSVMERLRKEVPQMFSADSTALSPEVSPTVPPGVGQMMQSQGLDSLNNVANQRLNTFFYGNPNGPVPDTTTLPPPSETNPFRFPRRPLSTERTRQLLGK